MNTVRSGLLIVVLGLALSPSAIAQEEAEMNANPLKGKALWQMVDTLYGDFSKCWAVPRVAGHVEKESAFFLPMPSILQAAYRSDKVKMEELPASQQTVVKPAFGIAYFLFALLMTIALSSIFLWIGASLAGARKEDGGNFMKALIASSFDRAIIAGLLIAITFGLGRALNTEGLSGTMGSTIIPVLLVVIFFFISTWIVKLVYNIKWGKAFLIQLCTRVAVILVAVFILGFATAVSLTTAT